MFPSLAEGYGLPVAESLVSGTPVITSRFGSMEEIAQGGGTLSVDPRDRGELEAAMRKLLLGDGLDDLRAAARARRWTTWDEYAASTWEYLVGD